MKDLQIKSLSGISLRGDRLKSRKYPEGQDLLAEITFRLGRKKGQIIATLVFEGKRFQIIIDRNYHLTSRDSSYPLDLSIVSTNWWRTALLTILSKKLRENPTPVKTKEISPGATTLDISPTELENYGAPTRFFRRRLPDGYSFIAGQFALAQVFGSKNLVEFNKLMQQNGHDHNFTWVLPGIRNIINNLEDSQNLIEIRQLLSELSGERFDSESEDQQVAIERLKLLLDDNYEEILGPLVKEDPIETVFDNAYTELTKILTSPLDH